MNYNELYKQYHLGLTFTALKLVGKSRARDIVHDVFIRVIKEKREVNFSFLSICVRNECFNILKKEKYKSRILNHLYFLGTKENKDEGIINLIDVEENRSEVILEIYKEIESLPKKAKQLFKLKYFEDLSDEEVAKRLNITIFTVRSQKQIYLKRIKTKILNVRKAKTNAG